MNSSMRWRFDLVIGAPGVFISLLSIAVYPRSSVHTITLLALVSPVNNVKILDLRKVPWAMKRKVLKAVIINRGLRSYFLMFLSYVGVG